MNAEQALLDAYGEWHRLTEAAGKAIRKRDWNFLRECQNVIRQLQPQITNLSREVRAGWKQSGANLAIEEKKISTIVSKLIALGERNRSLLQTARAAAKTERERLELAGQNLKRLQQSYVAARPAGWTSFS